jgi:hypothetical protein
VADDIEQFDLFDSGDREQRARVRIRQAAKRYGESELATGLHLDEKTLGNQMARRKREDKPNSFWKLNEDAVLRLFYSRTAVCARNCSTSLDEEIADVEAIEPEDAFRDVVAMALAGEFGNAGREKVLGLQRRVKKPRRR